MKHEGINSTRLAEILGIQASGISHIMSGRNKPSFDFLLKLLQRFPQISPDWLLLDKGPMYRDEIKTKGSSATPLSQAQPQASAVANPSQTQANSRHLAGTEAASLMPPPRGSATTDLFADQQSFNGIFTPDNDDIIPSGSGFAAGLPPLSSPSPSLQSSTHHYRVETHHPVERIVLFFSDKTFTEYRPDPTT